jgi:hypothetical protein
LVTTCRAIVERFLAAASGSGALGATPEFRHARTLLPEDRQDTIFVYLSSAFLRGLVSPHYQIELARRIQSAADMELAQMARLAAQAERRPGDTTEDLIRAGLLPPQFGRRADGSGPDLQGSRVIDSLRGARGSFTPIPDVPLRAATRSEAARVAARAAYYERSWRRLDPLMVGVKRFALDRKGRERLVIDAYLSPLDETKFGWIARALGPATKAHISSAPEDVVTAQVALVGGLLEQAIPPHQIFLAVQDNEALDDLHSVDLLKVLQLVKTTPWYLGAWPRPGFLAPFMRGEAGEPDEQGVAQLPLGFWRWERNQFSLLSSDKELLIRAEPHLRVEQDQRAAHIRLRVGDLSQTKLAELISRAAYQRARRASFGNSRLLQALSHQLHVPPGQALATAESLLDARLVCALGGQYELVRHPSGAEFWRSTGWPPAGADRPPKDYCAPLLEWFRGLQSELTKEHDRVVARAQLDMQRRRGDLLPPLPLLDLFGGSNKAQPTPQRAVAPHENR